MINSRWVLSAAHCFKSSITYVGLGDHDWKNHFDEGLEMRSSGIVEHPKYKFKAEPDDKTIISIKFDIALVKLEHDIDFMKYPHIRPVCLPKDTVEDYNGWEATITGWGMIQTGINANELQEISGFVQSNMQCNISGTDDDKLCAVFDGGEPCSGDSGGPLVTKRGNNYEQIGVMSFYDPPCSGEGYGGFTRVTTVLDWIKETVGTNNAKCSRK